MEVVLYPSKCRGDCWSCGFEPYPSCVRLIVVWLSAYPSKCRGDLCSALHLVKRLYCWREELWTPGLYYPNPQWRFPVWEVMCGRYSGNPSV